MPLDDDVIPPSDPPGTFRTKQGGLLTHWKPGIGGNPNRIRRPESDYQQTMRIAKQNSPAAMMTLVMVMNTTKDDRIRVIAANSILDRAGMNPPKDKPSTADVPKFDLDSMKPEELTKLREFFGDLATKAEANQKAGLGPDMDSEPGVTDIDPETGEVI